MIQKAIVSGLAATWVWTVLNDDEGVAAPLTKLLRKNDITEKWMECPWCSGAWFSAAAVLAVGDEKSLPRTAVTWLAASTIAGTLGSYLVGD